MATNTVIPHFLLPRGELLFRPRVPRLSRSIYKQESNKTRPQCRFASSKNQNPKVLEKPLKFNPPSHPQRLVRSAPRQYPGPPLSSEQIEAQKTKQYPNMMPPDDTWMHWFLTNRKIHIYITLVRSTPVLRHCVQVY